MPRLVATLVLAAGLSLALVPLVPDANAASGARALPGVVHRDLGGSSAGATAFWTAHRREIAKPLAPVELGGSPPASLRRASSRRAAGSAVKGTDTGNSTVYPNSANGVVFGRYHTADGTWYYRCSGSVVNSPSESLVMTSGHCVIDPETGAKATNLVFVPGYRDGAEPYGEWAATSFSTTSKWSSTAGGPRPDEAGDIAFLQIASGAHTLQDTVGAIGIAFNQPRDKTYTEYGYPSARPYDGSRLFKLSGRFADTDGGFSPATQSIPSDFTPGSSGGPWVVGGDSPVALSITDYTYSSLPGFMFGPYFGTAVQTLYESVGGDPGGAGAAPSSGSVAPSNEFVLGRVVRNRSLGTATVGVSVPGAGMVRISGAGLKTRQRDPADARSLLLPIRPTASAKEWLRRWHAGSLRIRVTFTPLGGRARTQSMRVTLVLKR
jgi:V8-like Glu-specific endopeptidase